MSIEALIENYQRLNGKYEELADCLTKRIEIDEQIIKFHKAKIKALEMQLKILLDVADKGLLSVFYDTLILKGIISGTMEPTASK